MFYLSTSDPSFRDAKPTRGRPADTQATAPGAGVDAAGPPARAGRDKRRSVRHDVYARIGLSAPDGQAMLGTVINLSADGALIRLAADAATAAMQPGASVLLRLPVVGRTRARIIWCADHKIGVAFALPIDAADYVPTLKAMGARSDG